MKKLITLLLAAALTVAASSPASAVDVKVDGEYLFQFQSGSEGFRGQNTEYEVQRLRLGLTLTANENLSGYIQFQVGESDFGAQNLYEDHVGDDGETFMRQAYIDWKVPGSDIKVRMGRHAFDLPSYASTSPMIADLVADGVVVSVPFAEKYDVTAFWTRMARGANTHGDVNSLNAPKYDLFGLAGTASYDSLTVSPWAMYGRKGGTEGFEPEILTEQGNIAGEGRADIMVIGAGFEWKPFDPVTLAMDAAYGRVDYSASQDQEGWYAVGKAAYALDFGEPTLLA
ncbi:MAG: porin, partial [Mailhella sp.]